MRCHFGKFLATTAALLVFLAPAWAKDQNEVDIAAANKALQANPSDVKALVLRANAYYMRAEAKKSTPDLQSAALDLQKALRVDSKNRDALLLMATVMGRARKYSQGIKYASRAIAVKEEAESYAVRAKLELDAGKYAESAQDCAQAMRLNPNFMDAYIMRADALAHDAKYDEARKCLQDAAMKQPRNAGIYLWMGDVSSREGDFAQAIAAFSRAIELDPKQAIGYQRRASVHYENLETEEAIADATRAMNAPVQNCFATLPLNTRALALSRINRMTQAIADMSKAISMDPAPIFYTNRGNMYLADGQYDKAIADFTSAVKRDPHYDAAYHLRGAVRLNQHDYKDAIDDFTQAIRLEPSRSEYYQHRGRAYAALKQMDKALADFKNANSLELDYSDDYYAQKMSKVPSLKDKSVEQVEAGVNRALAMQAKQDYKGAIKELTSTIRQSPPARILYNLRGQSYLLTGEYQNALKDYSMTVSLSFANPQPAMNRGLAYLGMRDYAKAKSDFQRALNLDPDEPLNHYYLAVLYNLQHLQKEEIGEYKKFLALSSSSEWTVPGATDKNVMEPQIAKNGSIKLSEAKFSKLIKSAKEKIK